MKKIIQFQENNSFITVLTEDGKIFTRIPFTEQIDNGKDQFKEKTDWETGYKWIELPLIDTRKTYEKSQELPF